MKINQTEKAALELLKSALPSLQEAWTKLREVAANTDDFVTARQEAEALAETARQAVLNAEIAIRELEKTYY